MAAGEATLHAAESTLMTTRANYRRIIGVEPANLAPASSVDRLAPSTLNAAIATGIAQNPSVTAALYGVDVAQLASEDRGRRVIADTDRAVQRSAAVLPADH